MSEEPARIIARDGGFAIWDEDHQRYWTYRAEHQGGREAAPRLLGEVLNTRPAPDAVALVEKCRKEIFSGSTGKYLSEDERAAKAEALSFAMARLDAVLPQQSGERKILSKARDIAILYKPGQHPQSAALEAAVAQIAALVKAEEE